MTNSTGRIIKIMSYNIKYATEEDGENSWSKRKARVAELLKKYEPDIFGVQEARLEQLEFLQEELRDFKYVGVGRSGGTKGLFNAIFYNKEYYEKTEQGTFWLSETPQEPSTGWDAAYPRICTFAHITGKDTKQKFWVFNTHFDHQGKTAVEKSATLIMEEIYRLNSEKHPVVLMGDFNLEPGSKPIQHLADKLGDSRSLAVEVNGPEETFNAYEYHQPLIGRYDYIFVDPKKLEVIRYSVLNDSTDEKYPSDHFPVLVELKFK